MLKTNTILRPITLALFFIVIFSSYCNSGDKKYYPVENREPRVSSLGFSIVPPPGDNWFESFKGQSIYYTKKTNPKIRTFFTGATEIHTSKSFDTPEEFLKFVKKKKNFNRFPTRYKNAKNEYKIDNRLSSFGVSYVQTYEDHEAKNLGKNQFLLIKNHGLICLHPNSPKVGVDVYYSDRFIPSKQNISFKKEGEAFLQSLKFLPINKE